MNGSIVRKSTFLLISSLLIMLLMTGAGYAESAPEPEKSYDGMIVVFDDGVNTSSIKKVLSRHDAELEDVSSQDGSKIALAKPDETVNLGSAISDIKDEKNVAYAQPNYVYKILETDPFLEYGQQPYMFLRDPAITPYGSNIKPAWDFLNASSVNRTTRVAVVDTGVDIGHEDLAPNLAVSGTYKKFFTGIASDVTKDSGYHGTHVAGIISSVYGNGLGGAGAASGEDNSYSELLPVCTSDDGSMMGSYDVISALDYAAENGAKVINMSLGGNVRDRLLGAKIKELYDKGITIVAAAGNDGESYDDDYLVTSYPSDMKEVISVCNINRSGYSSSSNYGKAKDIAVVGTSIKSTMPDNKYGNLSGTSMASPVVAGICALMLDLEPDLTPYEMRNILCATSYDYDKTESFFSTTKDYIKTNELGYGVADALQALKAISEGKKSPETISIKKGTGTYRVYTEPDTIPASISGDTGYPAEVLVTPAYHTGIVRWESSDTSIAEVDENGIIRGKRAGECRITASIEGMEGTISDSIDIKVSEGKFPTGVILYKHEYTMKAGENTMVKDQNDEIYSSIDYRLTGAKRVNDEVYWSSSDPEIGFVDDAGIIYALKPGTCDITITTINGMSDTIKLTVTSDSESGEGQSESGSSGSGDNGSGSSSSNAGNEGASNNDTPGSVPVSPSAGPDITGDQAATPNGSNTTGESVTPSKKASRYFIFGPFQIKAAGLKRSVKFSFRKGYLLNSGSGKKYKVKYKLAIKKKGEKKWKYIRFSKKKTFKKYRVREKNGKFYVRIRKLGGKKLKRGKKYLVKIKTYKKTGGKTISGKWSKIKKVKVR